MGRMLRFIVALTVLLFILGSSAVFAVASSSDSSSGSEASALPEINRSWYFAEGTTAHGFEEYICVQNPTIEQALVQATYMKTGGLGVVEGVPFVLEPFTRATISVNDIVPESDLSVRIDSDKRVVAERSMYWKGRLDGHDSIGVMAPDTEWYLAEGCTDWGFETWLLIQNPGANDTEVNITYNTGEGPVVREPLTVQAQSRYTIKVNDELDEPCDVSITVESDDPVIAERSMYWNNRRGGHDSIGTTDPAPEWFLAEGSNNWGFETWVLLQNPGENEAHVDVTFLTETGGIDIDTLTIGPKSRHTIRTMSHVPGIDFSTSVSSDEPVIAERSMYWDNGTGKAGHDTIGVKKTEINCYLAEGYTAQGFETFVLICNPNDVVNNIQVTYMTPTAHPSHPNFNMLPNSRCTINVNEALNSLGYGPNEVSIQVTGEEPISAERAMYWRARGGGHDSIGHITRFL